MKKFMLFICMLLLCGIPLSSFGSDEDSDSGPKGEPPPTRPNSESSVTITTHNARSSFDPVQLAVYNSNGQLVYTGMAMVQGKQLIMDTSILPKGVYTVVAKTAGKPNRVFVIECK